MPCRGFAGFGSIVRPCSLWSLVSSTCRTFSKHVRHLDQNQKIFFHSNTTNSLFQTPAKVRYNAKCRSHAWTRHEVSSPDSASSKIPIHHSKQGLAWPKIPPSPLCWVIPKLVLLSVIYMLLCLQHLQSYLDYMSPWCDHDNRNQLFFHGTLHLMIYHHTYFGHKWLMVQGTIWTGRQCFQYPIPLLQCRG